MLFSKSAIKYKKKRYCKVPNWNFRPIDYESRNLARASQSLEILLTRATNEAATVELLMIKSILKESPNQHFYLRLRLEKCCIVHMLRFCDELKRKQAGKILITSRKSKKKSITVE